MQLSTEVSLRYIASFSFVILVSDFLVPEPDGFAPFVEKLNKIGLDWFNSSWDRIPSVGHDADIPDSGRYYATQLR